MARWWRGGPDIARITKSELIENIPNSVHSAELWSSKLTSEITENMSSAIKAVNKEVHTYDAFSRRAYEELRQAQKEFSRLSRAVDAAKSKAKHFDEVARDYEIAARRIADENEQIRAIRELPLSRITLLENASMRSREAARRSSHFAELAEKEAVALAEQKTIRDAAGESYAVAKSKHEKLLDMAHRIKTSPQEVAQEIAANPSIGREFRNLDDWMAAATHNVNTKNKILKSTSRYINSSDKKFFTEYAKEVYPGIKRGDEISLMWMANPQNRARLAGLSRNKKFMDKLLELEHGKEFRESLAGLTSSQISRKLKIVGGAGAALATAAGFMSWFNSRGDEIKEDTSGAEAKIDSFVPSGLGAVIVNETKTALSEINRATDNMEVSLGSDPAKASGAYIDILIKNKAIIDKNVARWNVVVSSTDDKETATAVGKFLNAYSKALEEQINSAGKMTGVSQRAGRTPDVGVAGDVPEDVAKGPINKEHIKSIQNYLGSRFPMVGPTGVLDKTTIGALRQLEGEFDSASGDDRFSRKRLLVRPEEGHLIDLKDLVELNKRIQKY